MTTSVAGVAAATADASHDLTVTIRTAAGEMPLAEADGWELEVADEPWDGPGRQVRLRARWRGETAIRAGLVIHRRLGAAPFAPLVPGVFYGDNGSGGAGTHYPRLGPRDRAAFTAPSWDFTSERTPLPAVFARLEHGTAWLAIEPRGAGVGFSAPDGAADGAAELRVHRPGLERPFAHDRTGDAPVEPLLDVPPGGAIECRVWYGEQPPGISAGVAPVQRALQRAWGNGAGRAVDLGLALAAADAAVEGLLTWHYLPDHGALAEAVSFDGTERREAMHVAWVSGAPVAYALLRHGLTRTDPEAATAARAVLDTIAGGLAPCGAFWGIWTPEGWRAGWNGDPDRLHARTLAEATLFLVRALALEPEHEDWATAARSNLDFCLGALDERGSPGSYYHAQTGEVLDRRGTGGLLWAAALAEGAAQFDAPAYHDAAVRVGESYAAAIRDGALRGAPEDVGLCPSSEDGYNAVIATMALYGATGEARWLDLARAAADWLLTYRYSYDVRFPAGTPLARRHFRTRGADEASPSNHHLHCYGLICQRELLRLCELVDDDWYLARVADHLACFLGEVAQRDSQFGGPEHRGMMSEQWYTADWSGEGRAGFMAPVSHAWCLGLLLLAAEEWCDRQPAARDSTADAPLATREAERVRASSRLRRAAASTQPAPALTPRHRPARRRAAVAQPEAVRLLPGLYQVGGGRLSDSRDASSYLLLDETTGEGILVDCGSHLGLDALRRNIASVADPQRLKLVLGTHGHFDHVEAFSHLRHETPALFAVHHLDARAVRVGDPDLTCAGFLYNEPFHAFPVDLALRGGECFHLGEFGLEILHLPGHSPGSIGITLRYTRTGQTLLIPGDAVEGAFSTRIRSNITSWKRSMRRLMQEQYDFMLPSHLPGGATTALLADVPSRLARVYRLLETDFHHFMAPQVTP